MFRPGAQVLDVACGSGRHAIAAARLGADVVAIDADPKKVEAARVAASECGASVTWKCANLEQISLPEGAFEIVMIFNYLDRKRVDEFKGAVRPGGYFIYETFLEGQQAFGWGPTSPDHLLKFGELFALVEPFELEFLREVVEVLDGKAKLVGSVVARCPNQ